MDLTHKAYNRVDVIVLKGRLAADTKGDLEAKINEIYDAGRHRIVLDLEKLEYISSPGLRVLIEARKRAREWKLSEMDRGDVRIAHLPPRIREVFDLTGFTPLFQIFDDLVEAVASF
jgi:anti-sigma B factor antagonist